MVHEIVDALIDRGHALFDQPYNRVEFTGNEEADNLLNDLMNYPHAFVLACVMDQQIKAEKAWQIPYEIAQEVGGPQFARFLSLHDNALKAIFAERKLHRFNTKMASYFYLAMQRIHEQYQDDASNIWKAKPKSATVVRRFLQFKGVGPKIATMAANILARDFKIPMADLLYIDISPDVQVKRVFWRLGFMEREASNEELIYLARELHPEYPGIFDLSAWDIGRNWCRPSHPSCEECYLETYCPKVGIPKLGFSRPGA